MVRLTTTSYVVLGLLGLRGPSTSYDLKRAVGHSVGYFWPFPHAQLYSEPRRLAEAGLLDVTTENGGRRRQTFSLTEEGRRALQEWLAVPETEPMQVRDVAELKLFFSELASDEDILSLAREQVRQHQERLTTYESMQERFGSVDSLASRLIPLELGIAMERAALEFWQNLAARMEQPDQPRGAAE
ncbi:PadR family transcriptional regulator [Nesterenkonia sp.]|uniref:PadR family transcriptional regulator n=1 Tax=Nesterenkonia sp. TaxID=704201 RepID=UPI00263806E4|nr:PadR family transcriptional regulator [Nesterenkonia sp.]